MWVLVDATFESNIIRKSLFTGDIFCYHVKFQMIQILILHLIMEMTVFHAHRAIILFKNTGWGINFKNISVDSCKILASTRILGPTKY
jgi:hypothetical protein